MSRILTSELHPQEDIRRKVRGHICGEVSASCRQMLRCRWRLWIHGWWHRILMWGENFWNEQVLLRHWQAIKGLYLAKSGCLTVFAVSPVYIVTIEKRLTRNPDRQCKRTYYTHLWASSISKWESRSWTKLSVASRESCLVKWRPPDERQRSRLGLKAGSVLRASSVTKFATLSQPWARRSLDKALLPRPRGDSAARSGFVHTVQLLFPAQPESLICKGAKPVRWDNIWYDLDSFIKAWFKASYRSSWSRRVR